MRADSRCLSQKAFSAPPAARHTPRGGNGVLTAVSMRARPDARRRAAASWKRSLRSSSSAPENSARRAIAAQARPSVLLASAAADSNRAARSPSGLSSGLPNNRDSSRNRPSSQRSSLLEPRVRLRGHAGAAAAAAAVWAVLRSLRAKAHARRRLRRTRRIGSLDRPSSLGRRARRTPPRRAAGKLVKAAAIASDASAAAGGVVGVGRHLQSRRASDLRPASRSPLPSRVLLPRAC